MQIGVFASPSLQLEALLEKWGESELAGYKPVVFSSSGEDAGVMFDGRLISVFAIDDIDFSSFCMLVVLESALVVDAYAELLNSLEFPVVFFPGSAGALGVPKFSRAAGEARFELLSPVTIALNELFGGAVVEELLVTVMLPASYYQQGGVEELAAQTARLLNAQAVDGKVFEEQMTFNYFSHLSEKTYVTALEEELLQQFDSAGFVEVSALQVPVFHGVGVHVSAVLSDEVDLEGVVRGLTESPLVNVAQLNKSVSNQFVANADGQIVVGELRGFSQDEHRVSCWFGVEDIKFNATWNMNSAVDFLKKHHL